jgi:hypothetical protein
MIVALRCGGGWLTLSGEIERGSKLALHTRRDSFGRKELGAVTCPKK